MVLAKIEWTNTNGYEQKPVFTTTETETNNITKTTLADSTVTTTESRNMTTAIATVDNDLLAATTTTNTDVTPKTESDLNDEVVPNSAPTIFDIKNVATLEMVSPEKLAEMDAEAETCDKTDKLLDEIKEEIDNLTTLTQGVFDNNCEMKEQFNINTNLIVNNNNNNNDENATLACNASNTNTLQNNANNKSNETKVGISSSWCTNDALTTDQQQNGAQTERFLSSFGVDIASLNKCVSFSQQSSSGKPTNAAIGISIKSSASLPNATNYELSSNNAVVTENGQAKIILMCESNSHPFQARTIMLTPNIECKVGRLIAKSKASETNAIFDCKVLSRNHAVLWFTPEDQKFWVKDTKSSNGTFINDQKLGNEAAELHFGDVVKFGVDVVENSRKEVHGCIIASVKLYLPDGREAISADGLHNGRSPYSGEKCITYDELHRLNLYVQEVSNREKNLKSKLFNIQNLLDATRKNSGLCWQALIAEDQLLHRIHMLEKKLQVMDKNVPESTLRNEVNKSS